MTNILKTLINRRIDKPCLLVVGYNNKPVKKKPYAVLYLINHHMPDIYMSDVEEKGKGSTKEIQKYWGEFTYQFNVLGNTEEETLTIAQNLRELITYDMRYQELEENNIGIIDESYDIIPLHELSDSNEWIYKYSFDITFESYITAERITEIARLIEVDLNNKTTVIGGKK